MNKLKLTAMESRVLSAKEMNHIKGSGWKGGCGCGCWYENLGGSDTVDNAGANDAIGGYSPNVPSEDMVWTLPEVVVTP